MLPPSSDKTNMLRDTLYQVGSLDTAPTNQPQRPIRSNEAQYCLYVYTNNVKVYWIPTSKYWHIVLSILFSVCNLTMAN